MVGAGTFAGVAKGPRSGNAGVLNGKLIEREF